MKADKFTVGAPIVFELGLTNNSGETSVCVHLCTYMQGALFCKIVYARPQSWLVVFGILKKGPQNHGPFCLIQN